LFHDGFETPQDLAAGFRDLNKLIRQHGRLILIADVGDDTFNEPYNNCTFDRYERTPLPGQQAATPIKDYAQTLFDDNGEADGGWFILLTLYFRQLLVPA
jgi:hypothetical protein